LHAKLFYGEREVTMQRLHPVECTQAALDAIGALVTPSLVKGPVAGEEFTFNVLVQDLGFGPGLCAGQLACSPREPKVFRMERHLKTPELLSVSRGDCVIVVAPPQEPLGGRIVELRSIILREGQTIVLDTGSWHWIPFPLGKDSSQVLVVFRNQTGSDDLHFCDLAEPAEIDILR
jgi:hypothetical protein